MGFIQSAIDFILHLNKFLPEFIAAGPLIYALITAVIFTETGIFFIFLPGDSLIFATATFATDKGALNIWMLALLYCTSAFLGATLNYWLGRKFGERISKRNGRLINPENIGKTQRFYDKHGAVTIVLSRFMPIIRSFTPFVAGIGKMKFRVFMLWNALGVICWVGIALACGYFFGNIPFVQDHFSTVILAIIVVSLLPAVVGYLRAKLKKRAAKPETRG